MNDSKYRYILYLITIVILVTIGIQVYWNYKNYQTNKEQLIADIKMSLDNSINDYYTIIAQETTLGLKIEDTAEGVFETDGILERITQSIDENNSTFDGLDSLQVNQYEGITILRGAAADSLMRQKPNKQNIWTENGVIEKFKRIKNHQDSITHTDFELLTSKIIISISSDTLDLNTVDSLITSDLRRKNMLIDFQLKFMPAITNNAFSREQIIKYNKKNSGSQLPLSVENSSTFLPEGSKLQMNFENKTWLDFKRSLGGILISTLLVLAIIGCLFYLLNIIKRQKQLSEVKNDLISNITHEFKTPIATIGVALESLQNFNAIEDKEKTKSYLDMSSSQLSKLNTMVEKLLETATLDSENLKLNKERYHISEVVTAIIEKHKLQNEKTVTYDIEENVYANVDVFHFENAINNIIDNAFKYGGDEIEIALHGQSSQIEFMVSDNGTSLTKANKDRIFEKFYRVPKGNTHDVKGFGIGLYYTKKIIEKHHGTIQLILGKTNTSFKITLPYA